MTSEALRETIMWVTTLVGILCITLTICRAVYLCKRSDNQTQLHDKIITLEAEGRRQEMLIHHTYCECVCPQHGTTEWPLKMSPGRYLKLYQDGQYAELAKQKVKVPLAEWAKQYGECYDNFPPAGV